MNFLLSITCFCSYICISHSQCLNTIQLQTIMHSFEEFWKSSYSLWLLSTQNNCLFVFSIHRCSSHFYYSLGHCTSFIGECLVSIEKFFGIKSKYIYIIFKMSGYIRLSTISCNYFSPSFHDSFWLELYKGNKIVLSIMIWKMTIFVKNIHHRKERYVHSSFNGKNC